FPERFLDAMDALDNNHESYYGLGGAEPSTAQNCRYARRLQHPPSTLIIGLVCFSFFAGIAIVSNVFANATTTRLTTTVFVGFALLALAIVGDYFAARHEASRAGLRYGRLFGAGGRSRGADDKRV